MVKNHQDQTLSALAELALRAEELLAAIDKAYGWTAFPAHLDNCLSRLSVAADRADEALLALEGRRSNG